MEEIDVYAEYHDDIVKIWEQVGGVAKAIPESILNVIYEKGAFVQDILHKNSLLFLGIGASCSEKGSKTCVSHGPVQYETDAGRKGENGKEGYAYYKKMIIFSNTTNLLSLFFCSCYSWLKSY